MILALIHSPLTGPSTWSLVADQLTSRGLEVRVPSYLEGEHGSQAYWKRHATSIHQALGPISAEEPLILVSHSGSGVLLPAVSALSKRPIAAYIFVDSDLPRDGASRLDRIRSESPDAFHTLHQSLKRGEVYPTWTESDLAEEIPDAALRNTVLEQLHPRPLPFFDEPIPVFEGWPDAPCAYLQLTPWYRASGERAQAAGWPYRRHQAGHFHLLVDPSSVAGLLIELVEDMGIELNLHARREYSKE